MYAPILNPEPKRGAEAREARRSAELNQNLHVNQQVCCIFKTRIKYFKADDIVIDFIDRNLIRQREYMKVSHVSFSRPRGQKIKFSVLKPSTVGEILNNEHDLNSGYVLPLYSIPEGKK